MSKIVPLVSKIFNTGTKFIVTDETKDSTFGPGTTGFIAYVKGHDQDYSNVIYLNTVILKRGKTGKRRIDNSELSTPIFDFKDDNLTKVMPDEKRRYYVHIEPVLPCEGTIQDMSNMDFLGWAHAQAMYIHKLSTKAKHIMSWPRDIDHFLNRVLSINEYYGEDLNDELTNNAFREKFTKSIRILESTLVKGSLQYMIKVSDIERRAITDLCEKGLGDPHVMEESLGLFTKKQNSLQTLALGHGNKEMAVIVKEAKSGMSWL
jgi:hypothetical protein